MKNYKYIKKKVTIKNKYGNLQEFDAEFLENPKQHSKIQAIIWRSYPTNVNSYGWNSWSSDIYILPKNSNKWKLFYTGPAKDCPIGENGLNLMLFNLETQEAQNDDIIKDTIIQAKEEINKLNEQLSNARKNYRYVLSLKKQAEIKKTTKTTKTTKNT